MTAVHATLAVVDPALRAASTALWSAPSPARYVAYLRAMHGVVRASVPLMELAARRCTELDDPVCAPLRRYLLAHIEEERGHDDWLLADLAALGDDPAGLLAAVPGPEVARLVGAQYYWAEHHHPVALLGYIAVLEGNAPTAALAGWLGAHAGIPAAALRTVESHAVLDTAHTADLHELLRILPLTTAQTRAVAVSALHTATALLALFACLRREA